MQRRDTRKWNHYRTIENGFRSQWKVRVYTRLPADPLQKYLVREASVTLFFPLLKFWNNTTNTLPSTSIYTVKLFSQISPRLKILQNLNSIIPIFPLATRKISSRSSLEYPPFQQIFSRCTCVSRCSQPRESQIPPTSNLWLSRNTFQNTQPLLHQTFTSSITPLCIPFPIVAQYPGWKQNTDAVLYDRIRSFDRRWISLRNPISRGAEPPPWTGRGGGQKSSRAKYRRHEEIPTIYTPGILPGSVCPPHRVQRKMSNERPRESTLSVEIGGLNCCIAISFRSIERNVDSLRIGKCYWYWSYFKRYFVLY